METLGGVSAAQLPILSTPDSCFRFFQLREEEGKEEEELSDSPFNRVIK